jgi:hypothetical protein
VAPEILAQLVYTMNFSGPGGETRTVSAGSDGVRLTLAPGDWTVHVDARLAGTLYGTGNAAFTVRTGTDNKVNIRMHFSACAITRFRFLDIAPYSEGIIDMETRTVTVIIPGAQPYAGRVPTIEVSEGASVSPASGAARDFSGSAANPLPYTVTAADGSVEIWTVIVIKAFTGILDMANYLFAAPGGSIANPVPLPVNMELSSPNWEDIIDTIAEGGGKYVALDLSACTASTTPLTPGYGGMDNTTKTFDPGTAGNGEPWIASLVLPAAAERISDGPAAGTIPTFLHFTSLKSVTGAAVTDIGMAAFWGCTTLTTVNFPAIINIGGLAFFDCTSLRSISLPASFSTIGNPFGGCTALTNITVAAANTTLSHSADHRMLLNKAGGTLYAYPSASGPVTLGGITAVDSGAFWGCTGLTSVSFPNAGSIGDNAFYGCTSLSTVNLPAAASVGDNAFNGCTSLTTVNLQSATSIGGAMLSVFGSTGTGALTLTLGSPAPTLTREMFSGVTTFKSVTVKVPSGAAGYGAIPDSYTGGDTTPNWGNGFRGGGWNGSVMTNSSDINSNITLRVEYQ